MKKAKSPTENAPTTGFEEALALTNGAAMNGAVMTGLTGVNPPVIQPMNSELSQTVLKNQPEINPKSNLPLALNNSKISQVTGSPVYELKVGVPSGPREMELLSAIPQGIMPRESNVVGKNHREILPLEMKPVELKPMELPKIQNPEGMSESWQPLQFPANDMKIAPEIAGLKSLSREKVNTSLTAPKQVRGDAGIMAGALESDPLSRSLGVELQALNGEIETPKENRPLRSRMSGSDFLETLRGAQAREGSVNPIVKPIDNDFASQTARVEKSGEGSLTQEPSLKEAPTQAAAQAFLDALSVKRFAEKDAEKWNSDSLQLEPERAHGVGNHNPVPQRMKQMPTVDLTGRVVPGAMARDRLSSESVLGMSTGVRNLLSQGGGEIRVRLKPEHLGELQVRVVTNGRDVGLKIKASDEGSKQILEDSIKHLRESLASQNLHLSKVDVSVVSSSQPSWSGGSSEQSLSQQPNQHYSQNWMGSTSEQGGQKQGLWDSDGDPVSGGRGMRTAQATPAGNAWGSIGRVAGSDRQLDVRA